MALRLIQLETAGKHRYVAALDDARRATVLDGVDSVYRLAVHALEEGRTLAEAAAIRRTKESVDLLDTAGIRVLAPVDHPDPAHPENLQDVIKALAQTDAEIGFAKPAPRRGRRTGISRLSSSSVVSRWWPS